MPTQSLSQELKSERYHPIKIDLENKNSSHTLAIELTGRNKRVLEIGTSTGYVTKVLKDRGNQVIGVEIDEDAGAIARQYCESMIIGDVENLNLDAFLDPASIDVILMGDILEHLRWPGRLLSKIKKYLKHDGYLVVSLPNVCHGDLILNLFNNDFKYTSMGLLDETHLRFFGKRNIYSIFFKNGYNIVDLHSVRLPVGATELRMDISAIPNEVLNLVKALPDSDAYQFIFKAVPSEDPSNETMPETDFNALFSISMGSTLRKYEEKIAIYSEQLSEMNVRNKYLELEIAEMNRSILRQISMRFHNKFVENILPQGTKRRQKYDLGLKAGSILVNEGISALLQEHRMRKAYYDSINYKKSENPNQIQKKYLENEYARQLVSFYRNSETSSEVKKHYENSTDIIICVHNALDDVKACLGSVIKHTPPIYSLILVDDGCDEATASFLRDFALENDAHLLRNDSARGYTFAANQGLKYSKSKYAILLNSDTIITPDWLDRMLECAESDERIGIVGPLSNTASWQSVPKIESDGDWASNDLPMDISIELMAKLIAKYSCLCYPIIPFLNGFCLLIKRFLIDEIGYFDEDLFGEGYGEENDYCIRARKAQWKLAVADDVYIFHAQSRSYSNERRGILCERAGKTLNDKHGVQEVSLGVSECRNNRVMAGIRARAEVLWNRHRLLQEGKVLFKGKKLLIILPIMEPTGGAYVIIQEAKTMLEMGVKVSFFNLKEHRLKFEECFSDLDIPVVYGQISDIPFIGKDFDAILATINNSVHWMTSLSNSGKKLAYYIQDFEPDFYPKGSYEYRLAWESYTKIPKMANVTKTNWNKNMVKANLAVDCQVIGPSVDIDLFRPKKRLEVSNCIYIGAMIRPSTPRRNPRFTLEILEEIKNRYGKKVSIITFGCSKKEFLSLKPRKGALVDHIGVLKREWLPYLFNELDIFVDFSTCQAMGLTALEAMASGASVIVPYNGGCKDFIKNGINGLLVDTMHKESCIETLMELINNDELRTRICSQSIFDACQFPAEMAALNLLKAIFNIGQIASSDKSLDTRVCSMYSPTQF